MYIYIVLSLSLVITAAACGSILLWRRQDKLLVKKANKSLEKMGYEIRKKSEIAVCIDKLAAQNGQIAGSLKDISHEVMQISGDLSYSIEEFNISMKDISAGSDGIARGAGEQSRNASLIKDFINDIYIKSQQNLDNCENTQKLSTVSYSKIVERKQKISSVINEFDNVVNNIYKVDESIGSLKNSYKDIGGMIEGIKNISTQTNMLALNASIEAARAGESGKGFSVVAMEVKKLADESARVVEDIIKVIQAMFRDTDNVSNNVKDSVKSIGREYEKLKGSIADMNDIENNISAIVKDVSILIENDRNLVGEYEQINAQVNNLSEIAEDNKHQVSSVTASIQDEAHSVGTILNISEKLENISDQLFKYLVEAEKSKGSSSESGEAESKTAVVAITEYPPFIIQQKDGSISGIDVEILIEALKRKGINVILQSLPFDKTLKLLKSGYVDVVPTLSHKKEREDYIVFSKSYRDTTKYVFVTSQDSNVSIKNLVDLEKYNIGIVKGYTYPADFANDSRIRKEECISEETMFTKLIKGQINALIINEFTLGDYVKKNSLRDRIKVIDYAIIDKSSDTRMGFSKAKAGNKLNTLFEQGFEEIQKDGTLEKIYKKYTGIN